VNYFYKEITGHTIDYPDAKKQQFLSLEEYLVIAQKTIKYFGPRYMSPRKLNQVLLSEDCIAEVAHKIMEADWRWRPDGGRNRYSHRNYCADLAIKNLFGVENRRKNQPQIPLDSVTFFFKNKFSKDPYEEAENNELKERSRRYVEFLMDNSNLTQTQRKCLHLKYFMGVSSEDEIGKMFNPPVTRQAVNQNLKRALLKIRQTAGAQ
jgi:DNA-directed RNA polymerase specialized sigma24 family protein